MHRFPALRFGVQGLEVRGCFGVSRILGFRVWGFWDSRIWGFGFRVQGFHQSWV